MNGYVNFNIMSQKRIYTHHSVCEVCGTHFTYENHSMNAMRKFCSHECRRKQGKITTQIRENRIEMDRRFSSLLSSQGGSCALCDETIGLIRHYDDAGHPKGLLCPSCSQGIKLLEGKLNNLTSYMSIH